MAFEIFPQKKMENPQGAGGKLWRLKYRIDGKEKTLSIGKYPHLLP